MDFLGVQKEDFPEYDSDEDEDDSNLTDEQREKIALANKLKAYGIEDEDDLEEFREYKRQKEAQKRAAEQAQTAHQETDSMGGGSGSAKDVDHLFDDDDDETETEPKTPRERNPINKATTDVIKKDKG